MNERAVSPVVAAALLIGITVLLATAVGMAVFGLDLGQAEAPDVTLSFEVADDSVYLKHEGGEQLAADEIVVLDENGDEVAPGLETDLAAGESEVVVDNADDVERISVVWRDPESSTESILATFKL